MKKKILKILPPSLNVVKIQKQNQNNVERFA